MYMVDHGTLGQYFFNEDRWFWYFDDILISSRSWGLESLKHGNIWLWSSTRKHYNLKIEVDISDCAPRLEPEMIYVQTCKRAKSFRPHVKWLPKVTESEDLQQLCESLAGLHRVMVALPVKWSPAKQIAMPPFPRSLHSTALARIAHSEAVPWDILARKIVSFLF